MTNVASNREFAAALLSSLFLHVGMFVSHYRQLPAHPGAPVPPPDRLIVKLQASAGHADASRQPLEGAPARGNRQPPAEQSGDAEGRGVAVIDLEAARETARGLARTASRGRDADGNHVLAMETETRLGRAIAQAHRVNCREAYAGAGLLAIPLLARDALLDKGCNW